MICNVQEMPSCPLAHCKLFPALLCAPSFTWYCLTPWLLICLAPGPTLIFVGSASAIARATERHALLEWLVVRASGTSMA